MSSHKKDEDRFLIRQLLPVRTWKDELGEGLPKVPYEEVVDKINEIILYLAEEHNKKRRKRK